MPTGRTARTPAGSRKLVPLNGIWQLQPTSSEKIPAEWKHTVPVPALVDLAAPGYPWTDSAYHWYKTKFRLSPEEESKAAFLTIEQAMFGTKVWLNGEHLGGDIACYTSQEYRVAHLVRYDDENELIVRVGRKESLPPHSAVGNDQERHTFIPGIWGDVYLTLTGDSRIALVQVIPHIYKAVAEVHVTVENTLARPRSVRLLSSVRELFSGRKVSATSETSGTVPAGERSVMTFMHDISPLTFWSPDTPFLYEHQGELLCGDEPSDEARTRFGMREFRIEGSEFFLNGSRIFLKGSNIAFHRFLSDDDRESLPWELGWVKKVLIDIPKEHNFNFFRSHIGPLYNRWYDLADHHGMLIQNEWPFWTTTGSEDQITKEFTRWLQDNWNHPSIIIWDALNESSDPVVQERIVPRMKELDPTRPWESVDFFEEHPYIYSLGPVLNEEKFGFARGVHEIETSDRPSMVNEFLWWWLDRDNEPTTLTKDILERWLGPSWTKEDLVERQSFLATELVELFRRLRVDAIQPFVYLSNNAGPTAHWFLGHIRDLNPKPVMKALKNAFAPFAVSVELWDRHFSILEEREIRLFVFNDEQLARHGMLKYGLMDGAGKWISSSHTWVDVKPTECLIVPVRLRFPPSPGTWYVAAELMVDGQNALCSFSRKIAHVFTRDEEEKTLHNIRCAVLGMDDGLVDFLSHKNALCKDFRRGGILRSDLVIVGEGMLHDPLYTESMGEIEKVVREGKTLLVLEPEYGVRGKETLQVLPGLDVTMVRRADTDRGGYDSYVFAEDPGHQVWRGISPSHLLMFNGALGGEIVSQHDVSFNVSGTVLARCGERLAHVALETIGYGNGMVVVSRIQTRGRLVPKEKRDHLYSRRVDPVARQYMANLVVTFSPRAS